MDSAIYMIFAISLWIIGFLFGRSADNKIIVLIFLIMGFIFWGIGFFKTIKDNKKCAKINFIDKCEKLGIFDLNTEKNRQRAILIAKEFNIDENEYSKDILKFWNDCKKLKKQQLNAIEKTNIQNKLNKLKENEYKTYQKLTVYADYIGKDKLIRMLSDKKIEIDNEIEAYKKQVSTLISSTQQKEIDWAFHGGLASGIAGPAAGLATAMDIQEKNAQIRAQNQANLREMAPLFSAVSRNVDEKVANLIKEKDDIQEKLYQAKYKLVDMSLESEIINNLEFKNTNVKISDTGAFTVSTTVKQISSIVIFDGVESYIDGTISANLYQNNVMVGNALLVLPIDGTQKQCVLKGICLNGAKKDVPYEIKFKPYRLWAIEK